MAGVLLLSAFKRCIELAIELKAKSLTLPAIGTGIYGCPMETAAQAGIKAAIAALETRDHDLTAITFVLFGDDAFESFSRSLLNLAYRKGQDSPPQAS